MRYFVIILISAINVALVKADAGGQAGGCSVGANGSGGAAGSSDDCGTPETGYTYEINAKRIENVIPPGYPILYMYYQVSPKQNITWFQSVGPENPLLLEVYVTDSNDEECFHNDLFSLLDTCANFTDSGWPYLMVEIAKKSLSPGGSCSIKKGSYMVDQKVDPITVTFPEMLMCGEYTLVMNGFVVRDEGLTWGVQLMYTFEIPSDDNCID